MRRLCLSRVQFDRADLLTEAVRDVDVMPVDPTDCLPAHLPALPPLLNGRSCAAAARNSVLLTGPGAGSLPLLALAQGLVPAGGQVPYLPQADS